MPALDVHLLPNAAPAGDDRPLHPAAEPEPPPGRHAPAASSAAWTPSSPTPSTAPPACATRSASTPAKVRVIPHGAFDYLTRLPEEKPLPAELEGAEGPVILFFGLLRPYKGIENLLEAFRRVEGAELWIVGNPRMDVAPLRALAAAAAGRVRFVTRFVDDAEIPAIFRRADLVVLPYLDAEHSGVLYTGLAFGKPLVLSAVGGFPEVAATGAARLVPPGDAAALAAALDELVGDEAARAELAAAADARRRRPLLLGRDRPPHPRPLPRADRGPRDDRRRRDPLLALRRPDRLHPPGYPLVLRLLVALRRHPAGWPDRRGLRPAGGSAAGSETGRRRPSPTVSLIVPAYDEEEVIAAKVANALALDYPRERLQMIVASDGSTDATAERARAAGADLVLELPPGGKVAALNAAAEQATGELLAFSDANSVWAPDALRRLVEPFADPARRLRLRPGPLRRRRRRQPRGRLLALRDGGAGDGVGAGRRHRRQRRDLRGPPRRLPAARPLRQPRPLLPLRARQARPALALRAGGAGRGEDGPDHGGRVRPQTADDGRALGHRRRRRDALARAATRRSSPSSSPRTGCCATSARCCTWSSSPPTSPCSARAGSTSSPSSLQLALIAAALLAPPLPARPAADRPLLRDDDRLDRRRPLGPLAPRRRRALGEGRGDPLMPRALDLLIAAVALVVLSPFLLVAAIAIKLGSRGPVVYRQRRVGRDGARVRDVEAADDGPGLRPGRGRHGRHPRRPPRHRRRPLPAPHLARRGPQPGQRPARRDGDRRPAPDHPRPGRRLHPAPEPPPRGPARDHRLGPGPGPRRHPLGGADRARRLVRRPPLRSPSTPASSPRPLWLVLTGQGLAPD